MESDSQARTISAPKKYKKNMKFDASSLEISSDPDEIRKQVEFYFSDSNLPMDKFLLEQVGGPENRPVKISLIHSFSRMKHFQPYEAIVNALKDSKTLEVTEDEEVKRRVPLDKDIVGKSIDESRKLVDDKTVSRSIYAKGFDQETPTTQFEIEAFFAPYGPTNAIRLRRADNKVFKRSVFVEFADEATQQAFLALEPKPKWKGNDLLIKSKAEYVEGKLADIAAGKVIPRERREASGPKDWKKRREEDQKRGFRDDKNQRGGGRGRGAAGHSRGRGGGGGGGRGGGRGGDRGGDKGRTRSRGGIGGRGGRLRDPHKVPEIAVSTPESAGEIKREPSEAAPNLKTETKPNGNEHNGAVKVENDIGSANVKLEHAPEKQENHATLATEPTTTTTTMDSEPTSKKRARETGNDNDDEKEAPDKKKVDTTTTSALQKTDAVTAPPLLEQSL